MLIYIAGPLSGNEPGNVEAAVEAAIMLTLKGHSFICPHLLWFVDMQARSKNILIPYERWMQIDFDLLSRCDALLHLAHSPGADRELKFATDRGLTVYRYLQDVPVCQRSKN